MQLLKISLDLHHFIQLLMVNRQLKLDYNIASNSVPKSLISFFLEDENSVKYLIKLGANVNAKTKSQVTPLHVAALERKFENSFEIQSERMLLL